MVLIQVRMCVAVLLHNMQLAIPTICLRISCLQAGTFEEGILFWGNLVFGGQTVSSLTKCIFEGLILQTRVLEEHQAMRGTWDT